MQIEGETMEKRRQNKNLIVRLTFEFAIEIIMYCEQLGKERKYIIAKQLGKAGTSIGANVREAQNAESKSDFIHKMKIAAKEADETDTGLNCAVNHQRIRILNNYMKHFNI